MPGQHLKKLNTRRVVHKSTGGMLNSIPEPVGLVGNAPSSLTSNTVALSIWWREGLKENRAVNSEILASAEGWGEGRILLFWNVGPAS